MPTETTAYVVRVKGDARLESWTVPDPGPGEVLVKIHACGLNFADLLMIEGSYQEMPDLPFVPGMEFAGTIQALGEGVAGLEEGRRVAVFAGHGGLAGHVVVPAVSCLPIPDSLGDTDAAGFFVAYGTSHLALTRRARLSAGETLLVLGAAGGVGLTAVEIGKILGARVVAVARGEKKLSVAARAGADALVDSESPDLLSALRDVGPVDVVFDSVGGATGETALRVLAPEGRHLLIGFASGAMPTLKPNHLLVKNQSVIGFYWGGYRRFRPEALRDSLTELVDWHARGRLSPHISHVLPLDRAAEALELLRSRKSTGKVVVTL